MDIPAILHKIPLFVGLSPESLTSLTPLFEEETYPEGTLILREGEFGDSMYLIVAGRVSVTRYGEEDKEIIISKLERGSYFGEVALIDNQPRTASVYALEETIVLRLRKHDFERMLLKDKNLAISFYRNILKETIRRMRDTASSLTSSIDVLDRQNLRLDQINAELSEAKDVQDHFISKETLSAQCFKKHHIRRSFIYNPFMDVGGDFLSVKNLSEDKTGFIIADVMGHGISAALATGVLRSGFAIFAREHGENPSKLMDSLNVHMYEIFASLFATAYYALIDMTKQTVRLSKAGHMHPLIWKAGKKKLAEINITGPGLGIVPRAQFHELEMKIEKGDKMLFYTDGIIEQRNYEGEMFSEERLTELYENYCRDDNPDIVHALYEDFNKFCKNSQPQDDITLFLLEF